MQFPSELMNLSYRSFREPMLPVIAALFLSVLGESIATFNKLLPLNGASEGGYTLEGFSGGLLACGWMVASSRVLCVGLLVLEL
jgi:hypothetical protein